MIIPIGVTSKNEAQSLPRFLQSLRQSIAFASERLPVQFEVHILLNDNTDASDKLLATEPGIQVWQTTGGIVEAQRFLKELKPQAPFLIFSDADILLEKECVFEVTEKIRGDASVQVVYAEKFPLEPKRRSLLARSLYLYNLNQGYQSGRHYFNGQFFAIRDWNVPKQSELSWNPDQDNGFLHLTAGIRCDDIFLSRDLLRRFGPKCIQSTKAGLWYRSPETLSGMYRKYQRMRLEIERLHSFFPESQATHENWGRRRLQKRAILSRPLKEILFYSLFLVALSLCRLLYHFERLYFSYFSKRPCPTWRPVLESKDLS